MPFLKKGVVVNGDDVAEEADVGGEVGDLTDDERAVLMGQSFGSMSFVLAS